MILFSSLQFLADENIHPGFVLWLQKQGYHVDSISGLKLNGSSDEDVLKYAEQNGMVVITHDSDFGRIIFTSHDLKTGVIYLRPGHISAEFHQNVIHAIEQAELDFTFPFMLVAEKYPDRIKLRLRSL